MTSVKELVKDATVKFLYFRDNKLWYKTSTGFLFPVPINDTGNATFNAEDKALLFMRYIRKYVEEQSAWDNVDTYGPS